MKADAAKKPLTSTQWTEEEIREVARDFVSGVPVHTIAEKHNRSIPAIRTRLRTCESLQGHIERFHEEADKITLLALSAARLQCLEKLAGTGDEMMIILLDVARNAEKDSDRRLAAETLINRLGVTDVKRVQHVEEKRALTSDEAERLRGAIERTFGKQLEEGEVDA